MELNDQFGRYVEMLSEALGQPIARSRSPATVPA